MTTGNESPQSISFTGYYKGFSVVVTKRDEEAKVQPLIVQAKEAIDYMLEQGFLPSWNSETNKEVLQTKTTVVSQPTTSQPTVGACPKCNSPLVEAKKKDGSIYYKCSTNKWDKMRKVATGCDYVDWNN